MSKLFSFLQRRQPDPKPAAQFSDMPADAQAAAAQGIRAALRRLDDEIHEASDLSIHYRKSATEHDAAAQHDRKRHHEYTAKAHALRQQRDALAASLTGLESS